MLEEGKWIQGTQDDLPHAEKIAIVRSGGRIDVEMSLHKHLKPNACDHLRGVRTIACDEVLDVVECPDCGKQSVVGCNFDDEYS